VNDHSAIRKYRQLERCVFSQSAANEKRCAGRAAKWTKFQFHGFGAAFARFRWANLHSIASAQLHGVAMRFIKKLVTPRPTRLASSALLNGNRANAIRPDIDRQQFLRD